jgi:hypothetical protein
MFRRRRCSGCLSRACSLVFSQLAGLQSWISLVMRCKCRYTVAMDDVAGWLKSRPRQGGSRQRTSSRPMDDRANEQQQHASSLAMLFPRHNVPVARVDSGAGGSRSMWKDVLIHFCPCLRQSSSRLRCNDIPARLNLVGRVMTNERRFSTCFLLS